MTSTQAYHLAQTLCDVTELVLLPLTRSWLEKWGQGPVSGQPPRPAIRVGGGRATHHRFDRQTGHHSITFGAKMVADKLNPEGCGGWLSTREILGRGYFEGEVSAVNLLAHTGCHEFAHFLQTITGARRRGSVHNAAFYRILDNLHQSGAASSVRQSLLDLSRNRGQDLPATAVVVPGPEDSLGQFRPGDRVCFGSRKELQGKIIRINRKTCSVQGTGPCLGRRYRVMPQALSLQTPSQPRDERAI